MESPFFSIVIPTYNRASFLPVAIESLLNQTFPDWELIIIDDGSTDKTCEVVQRFQDSDCRIRYYYQSNQERSAARNHGIRQAKGSYICFLDSDDYYLNHHLQVFHEEIDKQDFPVGIFHTGLTHLKEGRIVKESKYYEGREHPVHYIWSNFLYLDAVAIHRDCFRSDLFPESFFLWEDTHLCLRLAAQYSFFQIKDRTSVRIIHEEGTVEQQLAKVDLKKIDLYFAAIDDLFENHYEKIESFLTLEMKQKYQLEKLIMFLKKSIVNRQRSIALILFVRCIRKNTTMENIPILLKSFLRIFKPSFVNKKLLRISSSQGS